MTSNFLLKLFNLILPPRTTETAVERLTLEDLHSLRGASADFRSFSGVVPYAHEEVRALVWELKYHANKRAAALAGKILAEELLAIASEELGRPLLVPVPMHSARRRQRGHNQTELLCVAALGFLATEDSSEKIVWPARAFTARRGRPDDLFSELSSKAYDYAPHALKRTKLTPEQQKLDRATRLKNVAGSMQVENPELVEGRVCVVVDDVTTTGATLAEAKRALVAAGARRVHTLALAQS